METFAYLKILEGDVKVWTFLLIDGVTESEIKYQYWNYFSLET